MNIARDETAIKKLGKRIKELRKQQNISQNQLAFESGIPVKQIGRIERGEINTSVNNIFDIAKILDVSLQTIFNW